MKKVTLLLNHLNSLSEEQFKQIQAVNPMLYRDCDGCICQDVIEVRYEILDIFSEPFETDFANALYELGVCLAILSVFNLMVELE